MYGLVQVTRYGDPDTAVKKLHESKEQILALANSFHPQVGS